MIRWSLIGILLVCAPIMMKAQPSVQRYDVVITELMPDPSPVVSLPNAEYVEIKNNSAVSINLTGWKLTTSSAVSGNFPAYTLLPDSFLILSTASNAATFQAYGKAIGIPSFPSLANEGATLSLMSREGRIIHAVAYDLTWYHNDVKKEGGWSLEMVDVTSACSGLPNWKASIDASGGTPGRKNSVTGVYKDKDPPRLVRTYCPDSFSIMLMFNKTLDSSVAAGAGNYTSQGTGFGVLLAIPQPPLFDQVLLKLSAPMSLGQIHEIIVSHVQDCSGNAIGGFNKAKAGVAQAPDRRDIVVNEILFNPRPNGFDYVELFNCSKKVIDVSKVFLGNRSSTGAISSLKKLSESGWYLFPGEFLVANEEAVSLMKEYVVARPEQVLTLPSLPSYPDDKGCVIVADAAGNILDEVNYSEKWHFALITNTEGVALERVDYLSESNNPGNWHSASSTSGYGTPTAVNSQHRPVSTLLDEITVEPKVFSPDNDGYEDIAIIKYNIPDRGYVCNINIFDLAGYIVRNLVRNQLLGFTGQWTWDGLDEKYQPLPAGAYVLYIELFDLRGNRRASKTLVAIAGKRKR